MRPSTWTLRRRLLVGLGALLTTVTVVIGVVSVLALQHFLMDRLDSQLTFAGDRSQRNATPQQAPLADRPPVGVLLRPDIGGPGPGFLSAPGQSVGTLGVLIGADGQIDRAAVLDRTGSPVALSAAQRADVQRIETGSQPRTVDLGGDLGEYRVLASGTERGEVIVTGLPLSGVQGTVYRLAGIAAGVGLAGLAFAWLLGAYVVRRSLAPLNRVAATATRVTALPLDRGEVALADRVPEPDTDPRTEVGRVGAALNRLLGHVGDALAVRHASEERVRRFVADASHELRTPLASIRGYAELTRRTGQDVPPMVAHALTRVESEAIRMTALVEDLLLLARLDEGRAVEHRPVDLSGLVVAAVGDAHVAGPDHAWRLELPPEPVTVVGDELRLHQVVANLLANARTHTPPGTTVTTAIERDPDTFDGVRLTVTDDGPGISPDLLPEIFERFTRGDSSRNRAAGSTGLGLSIAAAVVQSHRGDLTADSHAGCTTFTVTLPGTPPAEPAYPEAAQQDSAEVVEKAR